MPEHVYGDVPAGGPHRRRPSVYALPLDPDRGVALFAMGDTYYLFGGGIDAGETPEDALCREVLEECGHACAVLRPVHFDAHTCSGPPTLVTQWVRLDDGTPLAKDSVFYVVRLDRRIADPVEEAHDLLWVPIDDALASMRDASQAEALRWAIV